MTTWRLFSHETFFSPEKPPLFPLYDLFLLEGQVSTHMSPTQRAFSLLLFPNCISCQSLKYNWLFAHMWQCLVCLFGYSFPKEAHSLGAGITLWLWWLYSQSLEQCQHFFELMNLLLSFSVIYIWCYPLWLNILSPLLKPYTFSKMFDLVLFNCHTSIFMPNSSDY